MDLSIHRIISIEIDEPGDLNAKFTCFRRHVRITSKNSQNHITVDEFTLFANELDHLTIKYKEKLD